jgi:limonene-1,2-epoxide hydrolase
MLLARSAAPPTTSITSTPGDAMSDGAHYEQLVREFCAAWVDGDTAAIVAWFTADGIYHNIPVDPMVGHDEIAAMIDGFTAGLKVVEFKILTIASNGSTVFTERVDIFEKEDGGIVSLPVLGVFEFKGDKIAKWREYFDLGQFMAQVMPAE